MRVGIVFLVLAYVLSQFYRAFLAVLAPALETDIGATAANLSFASGVWFLVFAIMQIPVGEALDRIGPRITTVVLFALGGAGGALLFSVAQTPGHVTLAMALIGIGCSPVLMASYYIFAKTYSSAIFGTLAGAVIGFGSLGNIASSAPMAWAVGTLGWRETMLGLAVVTLAVAVALWLFAKDPPKTQGSAPKGSVIDLLRLPALWLIFPMMFVNYAAAAGLRGVWAGPYLADVFALDTRGIGNVTLVMGLAMIAGNFAYGPAERLFKSRKWVVFLGNTFGALGCIGLWLFPDGSVLTATLLLAAVGFFGASFPVLIAHGRAFFPDHLMGRGVTLMNLFGIGGVGVMQFVTARIHTESSAQSLEASAPYALLFLVYGALTLCGVLIYLFSQDRTD